MKPVLSVDVPVFNERYSLKTFLAKAEAVTIPWKDGLDVLWTLPYSHFLVLTSIPRQALAQHVPAHSSATAAERAVQ